MKKQVYIEKGKSLYESVFKDEWLQRLSEKDDNYILMNGKDKIEKFTRQFFIFLSKSVLSGEYLLVQDIESLIECLEVSIGVESTVCNENAALETIYKMYVSLNNHIHHALCSYRFLISTACDKVKITRNEDVLFRVYSYKDELIANNAIGKYFNQFQNYVLFIAKADHFYGGLNRDTLQSLILMRKDLESERNVQDKALRFIYEILSDKCSFLIDKYKGDKDDLQYEIDFKKEYISEGNLHTETLDDLRKKWNFINREYSVKYADDINKWQQEQFAGKIDMSHVILLMKYYKKDRKSIHQADYLLEQFNLFYKQEVSSVKITAFDRYAINSINNYLTNSRLSLYLSSEDRLFDELKKVKNDIDYLQGRTNIMNFYPYRKLSECLSNVIEKDIEENKFNIFYIEKEIKLLECLLADFDKCLKWCENNHFYSFQLRFEECIVNYNDGGGGGFPVFFPSSFNRIIDYNEHRKYSIDLKNKIFSFKGQLAIQKKIETETIELNRIKEQIEGREKQSIEIMGVFTAVITFLFTGISVFSQQNDKLNLTQALTVISILGSVLLLFSSSIYFLTLRKSECWSDYFKHPKFLFFSFIMLLNVYLFYRFVLKYLFI